MTKLCKDCKYYRKDRWSHFVYRSDYFDTCDRPNNLNLVSGTSNKFLCNYERSYNYSTICGIEGKYFEER